MKIIDATALTCPLPVLRAQKALDALPPGYVIELLATDPMAKIDIPHFCQQAEHVLLSQETRKSDGQGQTNLEICCFKIQRGNRVRPSDDEISP